MQKVSRRLPTFLCVWFLISVDTVCLKFFGGMTKHLWSYRYFIEANRYMSEEYKYF